MVKYMKYRFVCFILAGFVIFSALCGCAMFKSPTGSLTPSPTDKFSGTEVFYMPKNLDRIPTADELKAVKAILERRLDQRGITDCEVVIDEDAGQVLVRLPDEEDFDFETMLEELGKRELLTFKDPEGNIIITGENVIEVGKIFTDTNGISVSYYVPLKFDSEGAIAFEEATERLIGQAIVIYMDEFEISSPIVQSKITGGECVISGIYSREEAQRLADTIAAGALPVAIEIVDVKIIGEE